MFTSTFCIVWRIPFQRISQLYPPPALLGRRGRHRSGGALLFTFAAASKSQREAEAEPGGGKGGNWGPVVRTVVLYTQARKGNGGKGDIKHTAGERGRR